MHLSLSLSLFAPPASRGPLALTSRAVSPAKGWGDRGLRSVLARVRAGVCSCAGQGRALLKARSLALCVCALALCSAAFAPAVLPGAALAAETCPNAALRTGPSANLPDCRAYEQVTPVEKGGGYFETYDMGPSADGTPDLVLKSFVAVNGLQDNFGVPGGWYADVRTGSGWVASPLPPPATEYEVAIVPGGVQPYLVGSLDGRSALWLARRDGQPENRVDFWVTRPDGAIEDVGPVTPPGTPPAAIPTQITNTLFTDPLGESGDLSHIVYRMFPDEGRFWPFDTTVPGYEDLYEFVGTGNTAPMLVGVNDEGSLISNCGTDLGASTSQHNAMSGDGDTVFFTALAHKEGAYTCSGPSVDELFARIGNGQPDAHTVAISEPSPMDCSACKTGAGARRPATFQGASVDGSKVFFTTEQPLLGEDTSANIYEYDFHAPPGERVVRVSGGDSTVSSPTAEVEGVTRISEDGSHVYFVARGVLTQTPNGQGQVAHAGDNNLYVFERDAQYPAGRTAFIAALSEGDAPLWGKKPSIPSQADADQADVTPDGRFLVFASRTDHLTPDDTSTALQIFEYDAQTASLVRVSIGQNGYNDNGNTDTVNATITSPSSSSPNGYWSGLSVSADGSYVFFESPDGLTPQAVNRKLLAEECHVPFNEALCHPPLLEEFESLLEEGRYLEKVYASNIYEYHDGNVYLISDGRDISEAGSRSTVQLVGTDASGADVFFSTGDQLAPTDIDSNLDIYDARIDGGFPAPVTAPECSGDACQGPLSSAPTLLSPGSEFQAGGGNIATPTTQPAVKPKSAKKKAKKKARKKTAGKRGGKARKAKRAAVGRGRAHGKGGLS